MKNISYIDICLNIGIACSHTVRTSAGLVTSSSEVNSSRASMALDTSLSTCFLSKDVSQ